MPGRKDKRVHNRMKKQIAELLLVGEQNEEVEEALNESLANNNAPGTSSQDIGQKVSRRIATYRKDRQPGPQLFLTLARLGGSLISHQEIADLVHYSVIGPAVRKPRWCNFRPWKSTSQTIVLRMNCPKRFIETEGETFEYIDKFFDRNWIKMDECVSDRELFWKSILNVPVALQTQIRERMKALGDDSLPKGSIKLDMLLSHAEMADIGFPFPDDCELIIPTKDKYAPVTADSPLFALDCEMCITDAGMHELARISVIRDDGSVLLDTLVNPTNRITDYLTQYSGITPELLEGVTVRLKDVQDALRVALPPDAILVGHSLEFDLRAMRMAHPYCLDIGHLFNISGSLRKRSGLKVLSSLFLDEDIQDESGHCSVVDAWATMRLLKMKMEKGLMFGNVMYGWSYDEFVQDCEKKGTEGGSSGVDHNVVKKAKKAEDILPLKCSCGLPLGVGCIITNCQCQVSPPSQCVVCLSKTTLSDEEKARMTMDWRMCVRPREVVSSRPLSFYLIDSKKTVLNATHSLQEEHPESKLLTRRLPSSSPSPSEFVSSCSMELLEYALSLIEFNQEEEGDSVEESMKNIDQLVEKVISSSARHSLIILVLSSVERSICYVRVKD